MSDLRLAGFGLTWFFVTISVSSSIIPLDDLIFEYRLYLPSCGFFIAVGALGHHLLTRWAFWGPLHRFPLAVPLLLSALFMTLMTASVRRNWVWQDDLTLWQDVVHKSPNKARGLVNLARRYELSGDFETAVELLNRARRLLPQDGRAQEYLGRIHMSRGERGEYLKAIAVYEEMIHLAPDRFGNHALLAKAYFETGNLPAFMRIFQQALAKGVKQDAEGNLLDDFEQPPITGT